MSSNTMAPIRVLTLTVLAMLAFAGNSLFCRLALKTTAIDAASFTSIRLASASLLLTCLVMANRSFVLAHGNWSSAVALFVYAAGFSFAYIKLPAATGALLLFGAVQATMISYGLFKGERLVGLRLGGFVLAMGGLLMLMLPGLSAPPMGSALLMLLAGVAWGAYTLRGKGAANPMAVTAGNFVRTLPMTLGVSLFMAPQFSIDRAGLVYAVLSGALTSGLGYAIWYKVLPALKATNAATVQLSVPVIAALGGVVLLGEPLTGLMLGASGAILLGILLVLRVPQTGLVKPPA